MWHLEHPDTHLLLLFEYLHLRLLHCKWVHVRTSSVQSAPTPSPTT